MKDCLHEMTCRDMQSNKTSRNENVIRRNSMHKLLKSSLSELIKVKDGVANRDACSTFNVILPKMTCRVMQK